MPTPFPPNRVPAATPALRQEAEQLLYDGFWTPQEYQAACRRTPAVQGVNWIVQPLVQQPLYTLQKAALPFLLPGHPGCPYPVRIARAHARLAALAHGWTLTGEVISSPHIREEYWPIATPADDEEVVLISGHDTTPKGMRHLGQALRHLAPDLKGRPVCLLVAAFNHSLPVVDLYTPMILNRCSFFDARRAVCTPETDAPEWVWEHLNESAFLSPNLSFLSPAREALDQAGGWTVQEAQDRAVERDLLLALGYAKWIPYDTHSFGVGLPPILVPSNAIPAFSSPSRRPITGQQESRDPVPTTPQNWLRELHCRVQERVQAQGQLAYKGGLCRD